MKFHTYIVFIAIMFGSCNKEEVKIGDSYSKDGLVITCENLSDSRCPVDAQCIWEGEAKAQVTAKFNEESTELFWLKLGIPDTVFDFEIVLSEMLPYPNSDNASSNKKVKFLINRL